LSDNAATIKVTGLVFSFDGDYSGEKSQEFLKKFEVGKEYVVAKVNWRNVN